MSSRNSHKYASNLAFLDILFNMVMAFSFLFLIAFLLIRPAKADASDKNMKLRAEFMLTMTWPDKSFDDLDLWLKLPDGRTVSYRRRDVEFVTLDRDDRGIWGDIITDENHNRKQIFLNKEMMTIRAIVPGRYVAAVHAYNTSSSAYEFESQAQLPYKSKLELTKLNPISTEVASVDVDLHSSGQAETFLAFEVAEDGSVKNVELHPSDAFVLESFPAYSLPGLR